MDGIAMDFTGQNLGIWAQPEQICAHSALFEEWRAWCVSKAVCPNSFHRYLYSMGILVDRKTARRWWNAESVPSLPKLAEMVAKGATDLPDKLLGPAKRAASVLELERSLAEERQRAQAALARADQLQAALDRERSAHRG